MATSNQSELLTLLYRFTPYQFIQQTLFGQHLLPYSQTTSVTILDLNDYCLANIYKYLGWRDLVGCRRVCRRFNRTIDDYFDIQKSVTYDCELNGMRLYRGQYHFNMASFDYILRKMPNLRALSFERCSVMRATLATCQLNLIDKISSHIYDLKELHLTRSLCINDGTLRQLAQAFPDLTHLTVTIFNEDLLVTIINSFEHLRYLNLDSSILYSYGSILSDLKPSMRSLRLPSDLKNEKMNILEFLIQGNGILLERLEVSISIHGFEDDAKYFDVIGHKLSQLQWFNCEMSSTNKVTTRSHASESLEMSPSSHDDWKPPPFHISDYSHTQYEHRHFSLIEGLHQLNNLRVLILKETDYFDTEDRCSLLDDDSLLKIFHSCPKLEMVSLSCAMRCSKANYTRSGLEGQDCTRVVNHILNNKCCWANATHCDNNNNRFLEGKSNSLESLSCTGGQHGLCGVLFEGEEVRSIDSGISDSHLLHLISDSCLGSLDVLLPRLRVLLLRGVRMGTQSLEAIGNLSHLQYLRLDSVMLSASEATSKESFHQFISTMSSKRPTPTKIHLTNIVFQ